MVIIIIMIYNTLDFNFKALHILHKFTVCLIEINVLLQYGLKL